MTDDPAIPVPSGMTVTLAGVVADAPGPDGSVVRFRFLAPAIARAGGTVDFDAAVIDMEHLCQAYALPRVKDNVPVPTQIIVSLSDRLVNFGEADPEATQYFEAYRIEGDVCVWDEF